MRHLLRRAGLWTRTLHIYASMAGFVLVLLFAITGITLNHQDLGWGEPRTAVSSVDLPMSAVKAADRATIESLLQAAIPITTRASSYEAFDDEITVAFHAPGRRVHAIVNRQDGRAKVVVESRGTVGLVNDLHKGMETGTAWKWLVDLTAVLVGFSALTGLVTLLSLPKRRVPGLLTTIGGAAAVLLAYWFFVPR